MSTNTEQPPSDSAEANKADGGDCNPRLVSRWVETAIRVQDTFGKIENAFMASPENEIRSAIWDMFGEYTRTLAAQLSDDVEDARGWLEWFAWECDFGRNPKEMIFADGETLLVVGASDLLAAIRADENGCRAWDSSANAKDVAAAEKDPQPHQTDSSPSPRSACSMAELPTNSDT